jgi:hypothetical protein
VKEEEEEDDIFVRLMLKRRRCDKILLQLCAEMPLDTIGHQNGMNANHGIEKLLGSCREGCVHVVRNAARSI